ncbi:hypothetical protein [Streptomyces zaomyceticus]|uniref:Uncharacterized protein n=1 Tax=Streptomyces zaomyceticus TaxID=68286 RepID=A0ABZ1LLL2_9ACTN
MTTPPLPPGPVPLPYLRVTEPSYAQRAAATFLREDFVGAVVLSGPCPRCGHPMEFPVVERIFRTPTPGASAPASVSPPVVVFCTVEDVEYPGAPEGEAGCGAYWSLVLAGEAGA